MTRQVTELVSCKAAWLHVLGVHQVTRILNDIVKDTDRVAGVVSSKGRRLPARRSLRRRGVALRDLARREMLSATRFTSRSLSRDGEVDAGMIPTRDGRVTGRPAGVMVQFYAAVTYFSVWPRLSTDVHTSS